MADDLGSADLGGRAKGVVVSVESPVFGSLIPNPTPGVVVVDVPVMGDDAEAVGGTDAELVITGPGDTEVLLRPLGSDVGIERSIGPGERVLLALLAKGEVVRGLNVVAEDDAATGTDEDVVTDTGAEDDSNADTGAVAGENSDPVESVVAFFTGDSDDVGCSGIVKFFSETDML